MIQVGICSGKLDLVEIAPMGGAAVIFNLSIGIWNERWARVSYFYPEGAWRLIYYIVSNFDNIVGVLLLLFIYILLVFQASIVRSYDYPQRCPISSVSSSIDRWLWSNRVHNKIKGHHPDESNPRLTSADQIAQHETVRGCPDHHPLIFFPVPSFFLRW